jgi:hypothetical protein
MSWFAAREGKVVVEEDRWERQQEQEKLERLWRKMRLWPATVVSPPQSSQETTCSSWSGCLWRGDGSGCSFEGS